ncbi:hypothetical protein ACLOJK_005178 [Asimina triloba]
MQEAAPVAIVAFPKRPELTELLSTALGCGIYAPSSSSCWLKRGGGRVLERTGIIGVGPPPGGDIRMEERVGKAIAAATLPRSRLWAESEIEGRNGVSRLSACRNSEHFSSTDPAVYA